MLRLLFQRLDLARIAQLCQVKRIGLLLSLILSVSSCGFNLRSSQALPESINTVLISSSLSFSPFSRALSKRLPVYQLRSVFANTEQADLLESEVMVLINLQPERLERRLLSVFSSGQVAEYELVYSVDYQVLFPNAKAINNTMSVAREYQDDPQQILAKSRELELILEEMRIESADRIIRLLSSQYNLSREPQTPADGSQ